MLTLPNLISHRFRGFGPEENTLPALRGALDFGVRVVEFDVRMSRDGVPFVYHDEHAKSASGKRLLSRVMAADFATVGGRSATMPTLDELLAAAAAHENKARLLVDIKDAGFAGIIHALVMQHRLLDRVTYVSWLPEVLYALHRITPETPLCLSHWAGEPGPSRLNHTVFTSADGTVPEPEPTPFGTRSGWYLKQPLSGKLADMVTSVCIPRSHVTPELVEHYAGMGIAVTTFGYTSVKAAEAHRALGVSGLFIDSREVFDAVA